MVASFDEALHTAGLHKLSIQNGRARNKDFIVNRPSGLISSALRRRPSGQAKRTDRLAGISARIRSAGLALGLNIIDYVCNAPSRA
jgi:hypothetical protein